jgi:hypothetical protein
MESRPKAVPTNLRLKIEIGPCSDLLLAGSRDFRSYLPILGQLRRMLETGSNYESNAQKSSQNNRKMRLISKKSNGAIEVTRRREHSHTQCVI